MTALRSLSLVLLLGGVAAGQGGFDSGSDGSDGALTFGPNLGTIVWDPSTAGPGGTPLDADGDNIFHFTTIDIPGGTTIELIAANFGGEGKPVVWLASGDVSIEGILDLDGTLGHSTLGPAIESMPGAGGWSGGRNDGTFRQGGNGPGGGPAHPGEIGNGASHRQIGGGNAALERAAPYGNRYQLPLLGGSGGASGEVTSGIGNGGGSGGGAILIASSTTITMGGIVSARGGNGNGSSIQRSGPGSGGAIRLVANTLEGDGTIRVQGGTGWWFASNGFVRLQGFTNTLKDDGAIQPTGSLSYGSPALLFPPPDQPSVKITTVDGVAAPAQPTGSFDPVDVVIDDPAPVTIEVEASKVPLGTTVQLKIKSDDGLIQTVTTTALTGTFDTSTATATVTFPTGFSRIIVSATWTP